ncbi:MAG: NADH-quinone oxidoreductase subunit L [Syntrophobacteraceae bacterium]|nr:NADH-quinone oxidoreductase subunit L [Syntrophobacteraceae bacterium]
MNGTLWAVALATGLPFVSFVLIMILTRARPRLSAGLSIGSVSVSFICASLLLASNWNLVEPIQATVRWLVVSGAPISFGFHLDSLSMLMLALVAGISLLVQVYSLGYMAGDSGFSRYYAFMSLFAWAMMSLTVAPNILQLFIFWELVGLSSYLLIGFWYEKFSASQAGKKAFVMTRAGDVAFFLGVFSLLIHFGNLNILEINSPHLAESLSPGLLTLSALLIFGGIVGKSAQFPLLTWLPDAMEGPTPVSALLHSATMVAAGVYLFARLFPFFSLSPTAMTVFLAIGTVSMLLSSTMAMVSRDIKQVWAYSTISQLGFMIMGLAAGGYFAGVFHLTTHAAFKALLFLCSGVFIHHCGTNDIYELAEKECGRSWIPKVAIIVAAGALAGLPPLAGFFSKEAIMGTLVGLSNPIWLAAALLGVFLTAYYAFRVIFVVFPPPPGESGDPESTAHAAATDGHGTESPALYRLMAWPLVILGGATVVLGFAQGPLEDFLMRGMVSGAGHDGSHAGFLPALAVVLAAGGAGLAWKEFGKRGAPRVGFVEGIPFLLRLFSERWYIDHFYRRLVEVVVDRGLSRLFFENDNKVIDGSIDGMARGMAETGRFVSVLHQGMIQYRLLVVFAVVALISVYFIF